MNKIACFLCYWATNFVIFSDDPIANFAYFYPQLIAKFWDIFLLKKKLWSIDIFYYIFLAYISKFCGFFLQQIGKNHGIFLLLIDKSIFHFFFPRRSPGKISHIFTYNRLIKFVIISFYQLANIVDFFNDCFANLACFFHKQLKNFVIFSRQMNYTNFFHK